MANCHLQNAPVKGGISPLGLLEIDWVNNIILHRTTTSNLINCLDPILQNLAKGLIIVPQYTCHVFTKP